MKTLSNKLRTKPCKGEVTFHRLPDPERKSVSMLIRVTPRTFDSLTHIAYSQNRKVSDMARCALLSLIENNKEA